MSNLQARVQTLAEEPRDLAVLMARLDKSITAHSPSNRFITLFFALVDSRSGKLVYCNAGHNPPLLIRSDGSLVKLGAVGTVLGIMPELGYEEQHHTFEVGDLLAIYSDGVTESESPDNDEFGEDRLADIHSAHREEPAAQIVEKVIQEVDRFTDGAPPVDDVTLVVVRRVE